MLPAEVQPKYLSLAQAARRFPPTKREKPVHVSTVTRWIMKGVRSASGAIIKLEARRFPGGWKVTTEAIDDFLDKLTAAALVRSPPGGPEGVELSARRQRELARVRDQCAAKGMPVGDQALEGARR
jgi:hypothetical protein